jgi:hypothetical protein
MRLPVAGIFPHAIRKDNAPGAAFPIHSTLRAAFLPRRLPIFADRPGRRKPLIQR